MKSQKFDVVDDLKNILEVETEVRLIVSFDMLINFAITRKNITC